MKKRGGKRKDAGRPTQDGAEGVKQYHVTLDDETVTKARQAGYGSLSLGIRARFKIESLRDEVLEAIAKAEGL